MGPDGPVEKPLHGGDNSDGSNPHIQNTLLNAAINSAIHRLPWLGPKIGAIVQKENNTSLCFLQEFQNASVWVPQSSNHGCEVHGDIRLRYNTIGGGLNAIGCPVTDEAWARDHLGRFNIFETGVMYWTPQTNAFEMYGPILAKWQALNSGLSFLRYPLDSQNAVANGISQDFQGGQVI
jgi:uncharacterized protein with LGFP repeats